MDLTRYMVITKQGKDVTSCCEYDAASGFYNVIFPSGKLYTYKKDSLIILENPKEIDSKKFKIFYKGTEIQGINKIYVFSKNSVEKYWRLIRKDNEIYNCSIDDLKVIKVCTGNQDVQNKLQYLRELAEVNDLKTEDGSLLLPLQYQKINEINADSAMAVYLEPNQYENKQYDNVDLIFPFSCNASQFKAVKNAFQRQISVIQGPPGTGKTQTILNIIANLLVQDKTVQIVSNNNSAVENIIEKLSKEQYNLGFLAAVMGKKENRDKFIKEQPDYPNLNVWKLGNEEQETIKLNIKKTTNVLGKLFKLQEKLAVKRKNLSTIKLEYRYFQEYCDNNGIEFPVNYRNLFLNAKPENILDIWRETNEYFESNKEKLPWWYFLRSFIFYGIFDISFYKQELSKVIAELQMSFYLRSIKVLEDDIRRIEETLKFENIKEKLDILTSESLRFLHAKLADKFVGKTRKKFNSADLRKNPEEFLREYPIILSTTFSSKNSLSSSIMYSYVIMDEASQVDVPTGALALSSGYNSVIVGDLKQLPHVVPDNIANAAKEIFNKYRLPEGYSYSNNFLQSVCKVVSDVPEVLLREHYRCHPKIIEFCNQKFYQNQLLIMTEDHGEENVLIVYRTAPGNHRRGNISQRQIDVLQEEVLPNLSKGDNKGIIAPYRDQVKAMKETELLKFAEIDTVHKFQGREKDDILFLTVDDVVGDFADDARLLNVAISRAKKHFVLIMSGNPQPENSNISQLAAYIEYNNFKIIDSKIYSVFDYLYNQFSAFRINFMKKHPKISEYDSENLVFNMINDIIQSNSELSFNVAIHVPLRMIFRKTDLMNTEEKKFYRQSGSHVDFLIYNMISKKPVLAVEVDGYAFHNNEKQKARDCLKNSIFEKYKIPLLRLATNGSQERLRIEKELKIRE